MPRLASLASAGGKWTPSNNADPPLLPRSPDVLEIDAGNPAFGRDDLRCSCGLHRVSSCRGNQVPGDGGKPPEKTPQPLLKDDSMRQIHQNARILQCLCRREPSSKLDFPRAQMIAGVGKQRRDFKPPGAKAKQLGFEFRAMKKLRCRNLDRITD